MYLSRENRISLRSALEAEIQDKKETNSKVLLIMLALLYDIEELEAQKSREKDGIEGALLTMLGLIPKDPYAINEEHLQAVSMAIQKFSALSGRVWDLKILLDSYYCNLKACFEPEEDSIQ